MLVSLALAAIIVSNPAACPNGMWATPAGEAGYSCSVTPPPSETWWLHAQPAPKPAVHKPAVHKVVKHVVHKPVHHTAKHHTKPVHHKAR
jgi:hypothetical protein